MNEVRKRAYLTVEQILKHEKAIRMAVLEERTKKGDGTAAPSHDPTGAKAVKLTRVIPFVVVGRNRVAYPETWLYLVDWAYAHSDEFDRVIAELYYRRHKSVPSICYKYNKCSKAMAYRILQEFKQQLVEGACQLGLLEILHKE